MQKIFKEDGHDYDEHFRERICSFCRKWKKITLVLATGKFKCIGCTDKGK